MFSIYDKTQRDKLYISILFKIKLLRACYRANRIAIERNGGGGVADVGFDIELRQSWSWG
jgi:hypothetical protein